jgi:hypothetical protein
MLTLFSAISMAGGFGSEASKKNVQIIRQDLPPARARK